MREEAGVRKVGKWHEITKKKRVCLVVAVAGIGLAAVGIYLWGGTQGRHAAAQEAPVQEAQAQIGTISDTIVGTGNLQYEEGTSITIPSGIVVDAVNVEENECVSKGDVLAVVNQVSVLRAMENVQEEMDELDEQIDDSKDDADSQSVTAKTEGTVKKIYVQEGQDIADCMMEQGALLLLSIDGSADGEEEEDELAVTAVSGTVEEICVSEGDSVYTGTTLLKIANDGQSLEYQEQMAKRKELAQNLKNLIALSESGVITAETDGIIQSVNISAEGGADVEENIQGSQSAATVVGKTETSGYLTTALGSAEVSKKAVALVGSAGIVKQAATAAESTELSKQAVIAVGSAQSSEGSDAAEDSGQEPQDTAKEEKILSLKITDSGNSNQEILVMESPKTGYAPQTLLRAEDGSYQGQISWKPGDKKFAAETSYQAYVTLTAGEGYLFTNSSVVQVETGVLSGLSVASNGKELSFCITYPFTAAEKQNSQNEDIEKNNDGSTEENNKSNNTGDTERNNNENGTGGTEQNNKNEESEGEKAENGKTGGNNAESGVAGGSNTVNEAEAGNTGGARNTSASGGQNVSLTASSASASQGSSQSSSTENTDTDSEVAIFTIASSDTMVLSVNVDELDINSVSQGQQAEITLDAIEDETFTGTVTKVGSSAGSSSGGVAKYTVEVEIPGDERMKEGMNASATITVKEQENVVTIPINALQERGTKVFVYTQTDSDGNLSGEQEVTTGLSDGNTVEITEGLSEGDKVYYQRVGNISGDRNSQGFGNMEGGPKGNMGDMPEGGGMPGGGEMPGGGMQGGGKMSSGGGTPGDRQ